jgi:hypothetical protein
MAHIFGIVVTAEREMMFGLEPAVVGSAKPVEGTKIKHGILPKVLKFTWLLDKGFAFGYK